MAVAASGQDYPQHPQTPHGKKRSAESGLETEQRLSKRFDLLNIENGARLYIPVPGACPPAPSKPTLKPEPPVTRGKRPRASRPPSDDSMQVEDTPHRVYIHDLAAEFSDLESDEENPIFLSDIEKHIAKIPKHVLMGPEPKPTKDNQIILYNVPSSLSVPEEKDSVRKAIVEARARVRERQGQMVGEPGQGIRIGAEKKNIKVLEPEPKPGLVVEDEDAMDLD